MRNQSKHHLRKVSTRDFAYTEIKKMIITGELAPDRPIVEDRLATQLEISRTPLREALQRLEIEELVVRQQNGRLKVAPISVQEVKEIFNVRSKLEEIVILQAIYHATEDDIRHLANLTLMIRETYRQKNIEDILYYGNKFHQYLYDLSQNKTVVNILSQLNDHISRYRRLIPIQRLTRFKDSVEEHEHILQCIKDKDKDGAVKAMQAHIMNSLEAAIESVKHETNT